MNLSQLTTEQRNPHTLHIDEVPTLELVRLINEEDQRVPQAVAAILPDIARAVDLIAARLAAGGRLFYIGAGTSGRLGILDAVECPPTYRTDPERIQGIIAGGTPAIFRAQEGAEDSEELGKLTGSDEKDGKVTYVTMYGLAKAAGDVRAMTDEALTLYDSLSSSNAFLRELIVRLITRTK